MAEPATRSIADFASRLMDLAAEMDSAATHPPKPPVASLVPEVRPLEELARALIDQRHARKSFLPASLFHEPAWEILLALYVDRHAATPLSVKQLVGLVDAPVTTAQRWIDQLVHMRLLHRAENEADRRRLEITLSPAGIDAMERYLRSLADQTDMLAS